MTVALDTYATAAEQSERLASALSQGDEETRFSPWAACLTPLLAALGWRGEPRHIAEALPHFAGNLDLEDLRSVLGRMGFITRPIALRLRDVDPRILPCLFVDRTNRPFVLLGRDGAAFDAYDAVDRRRLDLPARRRRGAAYVVQEKAAEPAPTPGARWFADTVRRFKALVVQLFALSLVINLLGVAVPLGIMAIYDQVIAKQSMHALVTIVLGVGSALAGEFLLRRLRDQVQAHIAARMEYLIGSKTFEHILTLPAVFTERAPVGGQISRLREFESLREFFTGPLAGVCLDLPFVFLFVIALALLGGPIALVPVALLVIFIALGALLFPVVRRLGRAASVARADRHAFLVETLSKMTTIKQIGGEAVWAERFRKLSAESAMASLDTSALQAVMTSISQGLMTLAGVVVLVMSVGRVIDGDMSMGALIAAMALVWRVLTPISTAFNLFTSLEQTLKSVAQLNQTLSYQPEREPNAASKARKIFAGNIALSRVLLRHSQQAEPALINVNMSIKQGEVFAITGHSGAGKTTLIKVMLGLYMPQAGNVSLDGIDMRQIDPWELRQAFGYLPQASHEFYGTIAQNLRLAQPTATEEELVAACALAGLMDDIDALPERFDTRIGDHHASRFPAGFRQRLGLARVYLRDAPVMVFDEPTSGLDQAHDQAFVEVLDRFRGRRTIIVVTHRPSHLRAVDRVCVMSQGQVVAIESPQSIVPKLLQAG